MTKVKVSPIKLLVGLGNPGLQYEETRHNAGFWLLDTLAKKYNGVWKTETRFSGDVCRIVIDGQEVRLLKPLTFMNRSGQSCGPMMRYFKWQPQEVMVAHDELDLPCGAVRLKQGGGHGGHNGLRDLISHLGGADFWRIRLGIDHPGHREQVVNYVLERPRKEEQIKIEDTIEALSSQVVKIVSGDMNKVMNDLHRRS